MRRNTKAAKLTLSPEIGNPACRYRAVGLDLFEAVGLLHKVVAERIDIPLDLVEKAKRPVPQR
jgi:hypothetical protein